MNMANWSDRRFQSLIYPEAATASRKAGEEKARGFPCGLDVPKSHHHEAEYTDAVQTRSHAILISAHISEALRRNGMAGNPPFAITPPLPFGYLSI
jgi:hypothetical protein